MLTREQITEIYENFMEDQPRAGQDVRESYSDFRDACDAYVSSLQYEMFLWAYELGYKHGQGGNGMSMKDMIFKMLERMDERKIKIVYEFILGLSS